MRTLILALATTTLLTAEPDWRFAHPQADLLAGISTSALLESSWADVVGPHFRAHGLPDPVKMAEALDEVDAIYFSGSKQSGLMLLTGHFDGGQTMEFLRDKAGLDARFINRTAILVGDEDDMEIAAARLKDKELWTAVRAGDFVNPLFRRAREMAKDNDCWMIGLMHPALAERLPKLFHDVRSYTYGLTLDDRSHLRVTLNLRSREAAEKLAALESHFAPHGVKMAAHGTSVDAELAIDQAKLLEALPVMAAAWHQVNSPDAPKQLQAQAKPAAPPAPPVPVRRTVVIYGLETASGNIRSSSQTSNKRA